MSTSGPAPTALSSLRAADVLATAAPSNALEEMTRGTSGTVEIWWPRAKRRDGTEDAASAEVVAKRLYSGQHSEPRPLPTHVTLLLSKVDLLMPFPPYLRRREHTTRATHVAKSGLTGTMCSSTRDTRNTGNSTTCAEINISPWPLCNVAESAFTNQSPRIQQRSDARLSRSRRTAVSCSLPYRRVLSCSAVNSLLKYELLIEGTLTGRCLVGLGP